MSPRSHRFNLLYNFDFTDFCNHIQEFAGQLFISFLDVGKECHQRRAGLLDNGQANQRPVRHVLSTYIISLTFRMEFTLTPSGAVKSSTVTPGQSVQQQQLGGRVTLGGTAPGGQGPAPRFFLRPYQRVQGMLQTAPRGPGCHWRAPPR